MGSEAEAFNGTLPGTMGDNDGGLKEVQVISSNVCLKSVWKIHTVN